MASVKARFLIHSSSHMIALGKADQELVEYEITVSEKYPNYERLLAPEARHKLFYADRAEVIFPDGRMEKVKGGTRRKKSR